MSMRKHGVVSFVAHSFFAAALCLFILIAASGIIPNFPILNEVTGFAIVCAILGIGHCLHQMWIGVVDTIKG